MPRTVDDNGGSPGALSGRDVWKLAGTGREGSLPREQGKRTHLKTCKPMILAFDHSARRGVDFVPDADHQTRELARFEREHGEDTRASGEIVATAKIAAPRLATMASVSGARDRWVAYQVGKPRVTLEVR